MARRTTARPGLTTIGNRRRLDGEAIPGVVDLPEFDDRVGLEATNRVAEKLERSRELEDRANRVVDCPTGVGERDLLGTRMRALEELVNWTRREGQWIRVQPGHGVRLSDARGMPAGSGRVGVRQMFRSEANALYASTETEFTAAMHSRRSVSASKNPRLARRRGHSRPLPAI